MPELPEVETVRIGLEAQIGCNRIIGVEIRRYDLRIPIPEDLKTRLLECRISSYSRRGKYLLLHLNNHNIWLIHLGMSGRIIVNSGNPEILGKHDHLVVNFEGSLQLVYNDPRRFGLIDIIGNDILQSHRLLSSMGPEPLSESFNAEVLISALKNRKISIKAALLDQKIVAGIGNIYACEALFYAQISPKRTAANIRIYQARRLVSAIKFVLEKAIESGGSSLKDYVNTSGELGYFQHNFSVYGKEGKPCRECGKEIKKIIQNGRSTFFCPFQQR